MRRALGWAPAAVLVAGAVLATAGVKAQRALPLRLPLGEAVARRLEGLPSTDVTLSKEEVRAAGPTAYLARAYGSLDSPAGPAFSLYVGYYDQQTRGQTIHSPKNCLPGAGWEPLASRSESVATRAGTVVVNRYLLQRRQEQALVFYWYQGRGRVVGNEYLVKWDLLRDAILRRRSDEALVRIVVPVRGNESEAMALAVRVTQLLVPAMFSALPT